MKSHWAFQNFINGVPSEDPKPKNLSKSAATLPRAIEPQEEKEEEKAFSFLPAREEENKEEPPEPEEEEEEEEVEEVEEAEDLKPIEL